MTRKISSARPGRVEFRAERSALRLPPAWAAVLAAVLLGPVATLEAQNAVTPPVPREQTQPEPQTTPSGTMEGWVKLRYTVLADGTTAEVRVLDSQPPRLDARAAERAVEGWTFTPAMAGGEPIVWYNNESAIVFDDPATPMEASPMFTQRYVEIVNLVREQDFEEARDRTESLMVTRLIEIGLAQTQLAYIDATLEDPHAAYTAILRATDPDIVLLQPAELNEALRYRFAIEVELGRAADAVETYHRRAALGLIEAGDPQTAQAEFLENALQGEAAIAVKGLVGREPWPHKPSRRTFTFGDVDGEIRDIQVECDRRGTVLEFMPDVDWTLPPSWGSCAIFVNAKRDTTFVLYELN